MKLMIFNIFFAIVTHYNLNINSIDVKIALFKDLIDQLVYVQISKSLESTFNKVIVCKLLKALNNLKQLLRL